MRPAAEPRKRNCKPARVQAQWRRHPGTETDLAVVLTSPLNSVVHGMLRQPQWRRAVRDPV